MIRFKIEDMSKWRVVGIVHNITIDAYPECPWFQRQIGQRCGRNRVDNSTSNHAHLVKSPTMSSGLKQLLSALDVTDARHAPDLRSKFLVFITRLPAVGQ
jgi:hypothetical protein